MYGQMQYYPSPAAQTAQQRLQMLENQYPQFAANPMMGYTQPNNYNNQGYQNSQPAQSSVPVMRGRPVSNEEEANAAMIDFDGSLFIFPDKAHGKIYTKQLGLDGNIVFLKYSLDQTAPQKEIVPSSTDSLDLSDYAKKEDLDKEFNKIDKRFTTLEQKMNHKTSREVTSE